MMEQVRRIVVQAAARARAADAFATETREDHVNFDGNALKSVRSRAVGGVGLRVIAEGRIGHASSTNPDEVERLVASALAAARFGPESRIALPEGGPAQRVEVYDPALEPVGPERLVEMGRTFIERVRAALPEVVVEVGLRRSITTASIANSSGLAHAARATGIFLGAQLNRSSDTEIFSLFEFKASRRAEVDPVALADRAIDRWRMTETVVPAPAGRMRVLFAPRVVGAVLVPLLTGVNGQMVARGVSPLANRLGEQIAAETLSIADDGTYPWAMGTGSFDGEGVPKQRTPILERGALANFLLDLDAAARLGRAPTGNAARAYQGVPAPAPTTWVVAPGDVPNDRLLRALGDGLYVEQVLGTGQSNVFAGAIQVNVHVGFLVRNGEIVGRVKDVMLAGNTYEALKQVVAIGREPEYVQGFATPPIIFDGLTISAQRGAPAAGVTF